MKVTTENFNELRSLAKENGINTKGMNKEAIIAALETIPNPETRGRKVDPNSARQQRLAKQNTGHRGRPSDPNSAWNKRQKELEEKREKGELSLGRPVNPNSARQERLAKAGTVKRGRPAGSGTKTEEIISNPDFVEAVAEKAAEILASKIEEGQLVPAGKEDEVVNA